MTTLIDDTATTGGAWAYVHDGDRLYCKADSTSGAIDLTFLGAMEFTVGMSEEAACRCRDMLDTAITELRAGTVEASGDAESVADRSRGSA
ncbi:MULTISPECIES: hypothetical protein [Actinoalloteichus]|uniref:Uncharacterized protein n=1 Tax=Actinoalloteichus fjordicus TaxID=1612552 RepID=A0AAC9PQ72_9PSEU|nr:MULTISPECIES: hypothetical protein [Actinoalloteichus]APU12698.1 hypothetical protein UA74_03075 [Actinoalloteichus fjordicus]APU18668.1 hypothetical protein UA75_03165 [Actinoalloteichus sp. GBA129-24]